MIVYGISKTGWDTGTTYQPLYSKKEDVINGLKDIISFENTLVTKTYNEPDEDDMLEEMTFKKQSEDCYKNSLEEISIVEFTVI